MTLSTLKVITPILVACITSAATLGAVLINQQIPKDNISTNYTFTSPLISTTSKCHPNLANKVCVAHLIVQINSDEPQQVQYSERLPLKAGDTMKILNLTYCIPNQVKLNQLEATAYLFHNGIENSHNIPSNPTTLPPNTGCHDISNFQKSWQIAAGQHRVNIHIIKYDGSYRVVDKSFYFNLDVGQ